MRKHCRAEAFPSETSIYTHKLLVQICNGGPNPFDLSTNYQTQPAILPPSTDLTSACLAAPMVFHCTLRLLPLLSTNCVTDHQLRAEPHNPTDHPCKASAEMMASRHPGPSAQPEEGGRGAHPASAASAEQPAGPAPPTRQARLHGATVNQPINGHST